jgi:hypothetical protein
MYLSQLTILWDVTLLTVQNPSEVRFICSCCVWTKLIFWAMLVYATFLNLDYYSSYATTLSIWWDIFVYTTFRELVLLRHLCYNVIFWDMFVYVTFRELVHIVVSVFWGRYIYATHKYVICRSHKKAINHIRPSSIVCRNDSAELLFPTRCSIYSQGRARRFRNMNCNISCLHNISLDLISAQSSFVFVTH